MIIGITGKAQSGKDTACRIVQLVDYYRYLLGDEERLRISEEDFCFRKPKQRDYCNGL